MLAAQGLQGIIDYEFWSLGRLPTGYITYPPLPANTSDLFPVCHHGGALECVLQGMQLCAAKSEYGGSVWKSVGLAHCQFENLQYANVTTACPMQLGFNPDDLLQCAHFEATQDQVQSIQTANAADVHQAPTVYLNGALVSNWQNLLQQICEAYTGTPKPKGCDSAASPAGLAKLSMAEVQTCHV